jgi:hypothetical protein
MRLHGTEKLADRAFDRVVDRDVDEGSRLGSALLEVERHDDAAVRTSELGDGVSMRDLFDRRRPARLNEVLRCTMGGELARQIFERNDGCGLEVCAPGEVVTDDRAGLLAYPSGNVALGPSPFDRTPAAPRSALFLVLAGEGLRSHRVGERTGAGVRARVGWVRVAVDRDVLVVQRVGDGAVVHGGIAAELGTFAGHDPESPWAVEIDPPIFLERA